MRRAAQLSARSPLAGGDQCRRDRGEHSHPVPAPRPACTGAARVAVGDICMRFFDADGRHISSDLDERVLGIEAHTLNAIPRRIGVAGGAQGGRGSVPRSGGTFIPHRSHLQILSRPPRRWRASLWV